MTALTRIPENTNLLQPTKYILSFERLGSIQYFCQTVNVPGVNLGQAPLSYMMGDVFSPGNKITYNPLAIRFLIDEELDTWNSLYKWFLSIASMDGFDERNRLSNLQNGIGKKSLKNYSDATLTVLSALNNPIVRIKFTNVFPITLNDIGFDTTQSADNIITADATFMYDYYEIEKLT